jgi:glycosyl transferase family 2
MEAPQVTILVVPRERFSYTERSLQSIYEHTTFPFKLVYVSAGAPSGIKQYLARESAQKGFRLVGTDRCLAPNEARNLGLHEVETKYVVFMDNDALVTPGWLEALVRCADETGAWVVGPLYLIGEIEIANLEQASIHMAGGEAHIEEEQGRRILYDEHLLAETLLADQRSQIKRGPRDYVEFHCMLVRTEVFERLGRLDEQLLSVNEHMDFCFEVRKAGGTVYMEPESLTSYVPPPRGCDWRDLPFFMLRWSDGWNQASASHFNQKHGVSGVRHFGDQSTLEEDTILKFARGQRRLMTGMRIESQGLGDRPESPVEEAELMLALFQSVDRNTFDLTRATAERVVEHVPGMDSRGLMERLSSILTESNEQGCNVMIRPHGQRRPNEPVLLLVDNLNDEGLAKLQQYAFLTLETGAHAYQCWFAIAIGPARGALRKLSPAARMSGAKGDALLAGSTHFRQDQPDNGSVRVRLVSGQMGVVNSLGQFESKGLLPYLWSGQIVE